MNEKETCRNKGSKQSDKKRKKTSVDARESDIKLKTSKKKQKERMKEKDRKVFDSEVNRKTKKQQQNNKTD